MVKHHTRKSHHLPKHINTMHGLECWYRREFEKLGWMVLAKEKGYHYKIVSYKKGIKHLLESIKHLMSEYTDSDKIHDLKVLYINTMCLQSHVNKDFR